MSILACTFHRLICKRTASTNYNGEKEDDIFKAKVFVWVRMAWLKIVDNRERASAGQYQHHWQLQLIASSQQFCLVALLVSIRFISKLKMSTSLYGVWTSSGWIQLYLISPSSGTLWSFIGQWRSCLSNSLYSPGHRLQTFWRGLKTGLCHASTTPSAPLLSSMEPKLQLFSSSSVFANLRNKFSFPICINFVWLPIRDCSKAEQNSTLYEA